MGGAFQFRHSNSTAKNCRPHCSAAAKEPKKEGKKEDENLLCSAKTSSFFLRKDLLHMVDEQN